MSRWGRCDFSQFREFTKGFEKLSDSEIDEPLRGLAAKSLPQDFWLSLFRLPQSANTRKAQVRKVVLSAEAGALRTAKPGASMRSL